MTRERDFAAAILAAPQDDAARLAFADWLDDHGDPRAGCLRLGVRLRSGYGPRRPDYSSSFWERIGRGIEPAWWAEEARRLANEVDEQVGDGRKTAVLIALSLADATLIYKDTWDARNTAALRRAAVSAVGAIEPMLFPISTAEELHRGLGAAAAGDEGISEAFLSAFTQAGPDGMLHIQPSQELHAQGETVRVTVQQGLRYPLGRRSEDDGKEVPKASILISLRPLSAEEMRRALARASDGLLCLCPGIEGDWSELAREVRDSSDVIHCIVPDDLRHDWFEDVAAATRARPIRADEKAPIAVTPSRLGRANSVRVEADELVIDPPPPGRAQGIRRQVASLRQSAALATEGDEWDRHVRRLAQLTRGVVTIEVGGESPEETERRVEIACKVMHAGRGIIVSGAVPGGGVAYLRAAKPSRRRPATQALGWALETPIRALLDGSGLDPHRTLDSLRADEVLGLDVVRGKLPRWRKDGPLDSALVVRCVIELAVESACRTSGALFRSGVMSVE